MKIKVERVPEELLATLKIAGSLADRLGYNVYIVGGFVRDLFLNRPNDDIDLLVEGDGLFFARELSKRLGANFRWHQRFGTAKINWRGGNLDVATARKEYYPYPAALPSVEAATLRDDLYRRDFTINAMAICLNEKGFADLVDFFCGFIDLEQGIIRVLSNLSFIEDPTRILRAVRFEARLGLRMDKETERLAVEALKRKSLLAVSADRKWHELKLLFAEVNLEIAIGRLDTLGAWPQLLPGLKAQTALERLAELRRLMAQWHTLIAYHKEVVYLGVLLSTLDGKEECINFYNWPRRWRAIWWDAFRLAREQLQLSNYQVPADMALLDKRLNKVDPMSVLLALAIKSDIRMEKLFGLYLLKLKNMKLAVSVKDLKGWGVQPGFVYGETFRFLRRAYLMGLATEPEKQKEMAREFLRRRKYLLNN